MNTINNCLCYNPRGCKADALGGHPRQFSGLSDYSQLLVAGGDISFSGHIPAPSFLFFSLCFILFFVFGPSSVCIRSGATIQTPIVTAAMIRTHTATIAKQPAIGPAQSSKVHTTVRSCRPDRKECNNASKQTRTVAESRHLHIRVLCFSYFLCVLLIMRDKASKS